MEFCERSTGFSLSFCSVVPNLVSQRFTKTSGVCGVAVGQGVLSPYRPQKPERLKATQKRLRSDFFGVFVTFESLLINFRVTLADPPESHF